MLKEQTEIYLGEEDLVGPTRRVDFWVGLLRDSFRGLTPNKSLTRKDKRTPGANIRKPDWWSRIARLDTSHTNI
jgi:hypothetical protein